MTKGQKPIFIQRSVDVSITKNVHKQDTKTAEEERLNLIEKQLNFIKGKLKQLNEKKWVTKQAQWGQLKPDLNEVLTVVRPNEVKKVFQRKFEEEIRLLYDLHMRRYQRSMFRLCFSCCPNWILRKLKYYKLIDEKFQVSVSQVHKTPRTIYFYVHLLYIKLFILLVTLVNSKDDNKQNKKLGYTQDKLDSEKDLKNNQILVVQNNLQQVSIEQRQNKQKVQDIRQKITQLMANDWKDIINIQEWCSYSYRGFIQIDTNAPIQTYLQFKDCKLKTGYLFQEISSSSFDLRTCLIRKSKSFSKSYQYVLSSLHPDSHNFQLRFWLSDSENTTQNDTKIHKYILLAMRIGIKQKILRSANSEYRNKATHWIIHNYVHIHIKPHKHPQSQFMENQQSISSSYQSVSQVEQIDTEKFWWVNYRESLIKAIVQVSNQKIKSKNGSPKMRKESFVKNKVQVQKENFNKKNINTNQGVRESRFKQESLKKKENSNQVNENQNMQSIDRLVSMKDSRSIRSQYEI